MPSATASNRRKSASSAGKPAKGRVALSVSNDHDRLKIVIEDDGRGIDFRRVAEQAVELQPADARGGGGGQP